MRGGMTHRPTGLSPGLGEFFDFDGADVRALVGDGEGTAYEEGFLGDDVLSPGLDGGIAYLRPYPYSSCRSPP